jgi:hypothetical protein
VPEPGREHDQRLPAEEIIKGLTATAGKTRARAQASYNRTEISKPAVSVIGMSEMCSFARDPQRVSQ